jgi:hypothetical protein
VLSHPADGQLGLQQRPGGGRVLEDLDEMLRPAQVLQLPARWG